MKKRTDRPDGTTHCFSPQDSAQAACCQSRLCSKDPTPVPGSVGWADTCPTGCPCGRAAGERGAFWCPGQDAAAVQGVGREDLREEDTLGLRLRVDEGWPGHWGHFAVLDTLCFREWGCMRQAASCWLVPERGCQGTAARPLGALVSQASGPAHSSVHWIVREQLWEAKRTWQHFGGWIGEDGSYTIGDMLAPPGRL